MNSQHTNSPTRNSGQHVQREPVDEVSQVERGRARLAQLLGRLLARDWLRKSAGPERPPAPES